MVAFNFLFLLVTFASLALGSPTPETSGLAEARSETTGAVDLTLRELALSNLDIAERGITPKLKGCHHGCLTYYDVVFTLDSELNGIIYEIG
jgi:hypothetical protein